MEKPTGRHRKPTRGWRARLRWLVGAVLAAVLCSSVETRHERGLDLDRDTGQRRETPTPRRSSTAPAGRGSSVPIAPARSTPGLVRVPRPRQSHPSETGWCVDDDGVRGVRPYLFRSEPARAPRCEKVARSGVKKPVGEFDDLAFTVRTWLSMQSAI